MDELEGLSSCKEIFLTINPGYNGPFDFSVFTDEKLKEYDNF
jgi:hypothetical protein